MQSDPIVIVSAARTPMGAFQGELKGFAAPELGAAAILATNASESPPPYVVWKAFMVGKSPTAGEPEELPAR